MNSCQSMPLNRDLYRQTRLNRMHRHIYRTRDSKKENFHQSFCHYHRHHNIQEHFSLFSLLYIHHCCFYKCIEQAKKLFLPSTLYRFLVYVRETARSQRERERQFQPIVKQKSCSSFIQMDRWVAAYVLFSSLLFQIYLRLCLQLKNISALILLYYDYNQLTL